MKKGYLDIMADQFQEGWPRTRIARTLTALGLKRGVLTDNQVLKGFAASSETASRVLTRIHIVERPSTPTA